ncbi:hypothetical protein [Candidatus Viadribacter manganicus]|nr:hypothetical protein [Candidatus Viadribacter manganicus]
MLTRQFAAMDPASREIFERAAGGDLPTFISHYANAFGFLQSILLTLFTSLSVFALGWFRPQLSWPSRLNIAMGVLTAGTVVGLLLLPTMALPNMFALVWISPAIVVLAYFLTTLRGARGVIADTLSGAWIKSIVYTIVLILLVLLSGLVLSLICAFHALTSMQAAT